MLKLYLKSFNSKKFSPAALSLWLLSLWMGPFFRGSLLNCTNTLDTVKWPFAKLVSTNLTYREKKTYLAPKTVSRQPHKVLYHAQTFPTMIRVHSMNKKITDTFSPPPPCHHRPTSWSPDSSRLLELELVDLSNVGRWWHGVGVKKCR